MIRKSVKMVNYFLFKVRIKEKKFTVTFYMSGPLIQRQIEISDRDVNLLLVILYNRKSHPNIVCTLNVNTLLLMENKQRVM